MSGKFLPERSDEPKAQACHALDVLDGMADKWHSECGVTAMIKNAVSPTRLSRKAPAVVREQFIARMEQQIDAIVRQAFIEGAYRAITGAQDERAEMLRQGIQPPCTCGRELGR